MTKIVWLLTLLWAAPAFAQFPVSLEASWDPHPVEAAVAGYTLTVDGVAYALAWTACTDRCRVRFSAAAPGPREIRVVAADVKGLVGDPAALPFTLTPAGELTFPGDCPPGAVVLDLGDWTRSVPVRGLVRVQFFLLRSATPVVELRLETKTGTSGAWEVQRTLTGGDYSPVSGAYFVLPPVPGRYDIRVIARNAAGCEAGSDRPATVTVVGPAVP